jgi:hypothetical protein
MYVYIRKDDKVASGDEQARDSEIKEAIDRVLYQCDECEMFPIKGNRHRCTVREVGPISTISLKMLFV